jgi:hypothetical protein
MLTRSKEVVLIVDPLLEVVQCIYLGHCVSLRFVGIRAFVVCDTVARSVDFLIWQSCKVELLNRNVAYTEDAMTDRLTLISFFAASRMLRVA